MTPQISCLIPVYNGERYLELALDSILSQTFADFEIVVVDDGSRDGSPAILSKYASKDKRIKVFTKPNGGIVSALNFGLQHCQGKYVARMDCDDIALPDRFAMQMKAFADNPDAVAIGGRIASIDEDGNIFTTFTSPSRVTHTRLDIFPPIVANVQHSAGTFLKSALDATGGYRSTFPHAEDYDLYLRLSEYGNFYNPASPSIYYRVHATSLSMKNMTAQETSAVLAELSAYARKAKVADPGAEINPLSVAEYHQRLGNKLCPETTINRYINFRLWRRSAGANLPEETRRYRRAMVAGLLNPSNYRTPFDRSLNKRIVLSFLRRRYLNVKTILSKNPK